MTAVTSDATTDTMTTVSAAGRGRSERGSSTVELVLLTPALMVAVFLIIQTALYLHARQVLLAAAQQGARLVRTNTAVSQADTDRNRQATLAYIHQLGPRLIAVPTVSIAHSSGNTVTVTVTGRALSILPGLHLTISEHATGVQERFYAP